MWMKVAGAAPSKLYPEVVDWVNQQNAAAYAGYTDWRLPGGTDVRSDLTATTEDNQYFYNATGSEFGYLFYVHLGGRPGCHILKSGLACTNSNADPDLLLFENIPPAPPDGPFNNTIYWTGMESASSDGFNWTFAFGSGLYREQPIGETRRFRGWAVRDVIPIPAQCADGIDNDGDGLIDMDDRNCCSASDDDELAQDAPRAGPLPQCSDTIDNDDDCLIDHPDDNLCASADDPSESMSCVQFLFYDWVCLSRKAWQIGYLTLTVFGVVVAFATYGMWKRRRKDD